MLRLLLRVLFIIVFYMKIYFSGIGGVGIGPLAEIAHDGGYTVVGSDTSESLMTQELARRGLTVHIGQDGSQITAEHATEPIDWLVYTAALPNNHPELVFAQNHGIRTSKRDEFLAEFIREKDLKLIAIAGTHGKTTTTGMMVWALKQLGVPVSYSVGSGLSFGSSGAFDPNSDFFVYECDEFDRNFLHFHPWVSLITSIDYDHPDTYPTQNDYYAAFSEFIRQSKQCIMWQQDFNYLAATEDIKTSPHLIDKSESVVRKKLDEIKLAGKHNRENAYLVLTELINGGTDEAHAKQILADFPGTNRRFEKLADGLYSDYGHHPVEIAATLQMAHELSDQVVLVYQPHQNIRQHEIYSQYTDEIFADANEIYWLPTYLTRENPNSPTLAPQELTSGLTNRNLVHYAQLNDELWRDIQNARAAGKLVLCMGAGTIDGWLRARLNQAKDEG